MSHAIRRALAAALVAVGAHAQAQTTPPPFYQGKQISLLIGGAPGGGFDLYARLVARFLGRHIPGAPIVLPQTMAGAGGNLAAGYLANVAPSDGLTIGAITAAGVQDALVRGRGVVKYDPAALNYLGSANSDSFVCVMNRDAPARTFADVFQTEVVIGGSVGSPHDMPTLSNNVLGAKFKLVNGYPGTREVTVAMDKNEVQGICGVAHSSIASMRPDWFQAGTARIIAQEGLAHDPSLPEGTPVTYDFAKTDEARAIMSIVYSQGIYTRPFALAQGVPSARVETLRAAFMATLQDPELLAEAARQSLPIHPMSGDEVQAAVRKVFSAPPALVAKVKAALEP